MPADLRHLGHAAGEVVERAGLERCKDQCRVPWILAVERHDMAFRAGISVDVRENLRFLAEDFERIRARGKFDGVQAWTYALGSLLRCCWRSQQRGRAGPAGLGSRWFSEEDITPEPRTKKPSAVELVIQLGEIVFEDFRRSRSSMVVVVQELGLSRSSRGCQSACRDSQC